MTAEPPVQPPAQPRAVRRPRTPRPSDWRVAVWRTFLRAHARVAGELEHDLTARLGLPLAWYDVLVQLAEAPGRRLRMAELADRVLLSRSGLTRLIDRLQTAGLVRREPSADDARGTFTVLTEDGLARLRAAAPVHLAGVDRHWLRHFTDEELRVLGELLSRVAPDSP
ncbi:MarR family winged helix-turn-helix transcriptional regulator [uncultured Jatrophihabitans sp.]|uniref:MarR family winged helix-turn-helix transcriptional regulator n=1 Tax=uncultured Jatrophihabitans sp. TaxID=1610747 RepID=UPI0035CB513D